MTGRDKFSSHRRLIMALRRVAALLPTFAIQPLCYLPRSLGVLGRYIFAAKTFKSLGDSCYFSKYCVLKNTHNLTVGNRFSIHEFCYIDAIGEIRIGDDVAIAHGCSILSANHTWDDTSLPIKYNPAQFSSVSIENDVWIGCGVRILAGTHIQSRVVVAAGAVVRGKLESGYLYGGVPARKLKAL